MSTCHSAPEHADESLPDPRLLEPAEPADLGLRLPFCELAFEILLAPPLEEPRFGFFTRPPSFDGKSPGSGDVGALLLLPAPK